MSHGGMADKENHKVSRDNTFLTEPTAILTLCKITLQNV